MREFGFAKCPHCGRAAPLVTQNEAMCNCGRWFKVKPEQISWVPEDEARIAAQLLRTKMYIAREVPA